MSVPLLDVNAQNLPLESELTEAFKKVLASGRFILGAEMEAFERECAEMVGARHAISVSSGTDALLLAMMALGIGPGDEVLCPAFTFFATASAVSRVGATPVFTDVCPVCFNMDVNSARSKITARTKAMIPVHLFGQSADMDPLLELANGHGIAVVEDAAQAIGSRYKGRGCGSMGLCGTYSFFPSKNLGGFGDGGMLVTNDDEFADKCEVLRMHGMRPKYFHPMIGGNFRMDALQCALLRVKLSRYADYTEARRQNASHYVEALLKLPGVVQADPAHCKCASSQAEWLERVGARVVLPVAYAHNDHIWNQFTLRVIGDGKRESLMKHLQQRQIGCDIYYPLTLDQQECFAGLPEASRRGCDVAHRIAAEVLSIPIYGELSAEQRLEVIGAIADWLGA